MNATYDITRRRAVSTAPSFASRERKSAPPRTTSVCNPAQEFCLLQVSGPKCHPRSDTQQIRIVRFLPNPLDSAGSGKPQLWYTELMKEYQRNDPLCSLHLIQCGLSNPHQTTNNSISYGLCAVDEKATWEYKNEKVLRLCRAMNDAHLANYAKFTERVSEEMKNEGGSEEFRMVNSAPNPTVKKILRERAREEDGGIEESKDEPEVVPRFEYSEGVSSSARLAVETFPSSLEMRGQKFAVIGLIEDYELHTEVAIAPLGAFDTSNDAVSFIEHLIEPKFPDQIFGVVSMYEWIDPHQALKNCDRKTYKLNEEQLIYDSKDAMDAQLDAMKKQAEFEGWEMPYTDVEADLMPPIWEEEKKEDTA